jgi:hypothetical protein
MKSVAAQLAASQSETGAFVSSVNGQEDHNGFITALVLRTLRGYLHEPIFDSVRERALDFLERCGRGQRPGAFGFWPEDSRPAWAMNVPADADDTAIITLELLRYGRIKRQDALKTVYKVLLSNRVLSQDTLRPTWVRVGTILTWLPNSTQLRSSHPNVVDCCVNANVAALLAYLELTHLSCYKEICTMIEGAVQWAESSSFRLGTLTPFYPNVLEFYLALFHAVKCGAWQLRPSLEQLASVTEFNKADEAICSSAYGKTKWYCPVLSELRKMIEPLGGATHLKNFMRFHTRL